MENDNPPPSEGTQKQLKELQERVNGGDRQEVIQNALKVCVERAEATDTILLGLPRPEQRLMADNRVPLRQAIEAIDQEAKAIFAYREATANVTANRDRLLLIRGKQFALQAQLEELTLRFGTPIEQQVVLAGRTHYAYLIAVDPALERLAPQNIQKTLDEIAAANACVAREEGVIRLILADPATPETTRKTLQTRLQACERYSKEIAVTNTIVRAAREL